MRCASEARLSRCSTSAVPWTSACVPRFVINHLPGRIRVSALVRLKCSMSNISAVNEALRSTSTYNLVTDIWRTFSRLLTLGTPSHFSHLDNRNPYSGKAKATSRNAEGTPSGVPHNEPVSQPSPTSRPIKQLPTLKRTKPVRRHEEKRK